MSPEAAEILSLFDDESRLMRQLPPVLGTIARVAGLEAAIEIGVRFGGGELYIAASPQPEHKLVKTCGADAAFKLACHYADGFAAIIHIPSTLRGVALRRLKGIKLLEAGVSLREVARRVGASRSTVQGWRNAVEGDA